MTTDLVRCGTCPRGCRLAPGCVGACKARSNENGRVIPSAYGRVTSLAIDPVEKKPLARWKPGSTVLSLGGYGCNLRCAWCQNHTISQVGEGEVGWRQVLPEELIALAVQAREQDGRMAGVAYTYNEPLVCWEYVRDAGGLVHEAGFANVLVTAGCVDELVVRELAPLLDAANIDLKSFRPETYRRLGGDLPTVQHTIELLANVPTCHVEVTTLVVPGVNDSDEEMDALSAWLASVDPDMTLHVTRFHPAWRMRDRGPTPVKTMHRLAKVARGNLDHVCLGNMPR